MPQMNTPSAMPVPPFTPEAVVVPAAEPDFELGFECAYPTLQIERWQQETAQAAAAGDAH